MNNTTGVGFVSDVLNWFAKPFNSGGNALNWILFVGLLVIAAFFWQHVLRSTGE
jgi:hypothetical protein